MAQQDDGSGRAPVVIVRPTTSVTSGVAVTQKLVGLLLHSETFFDEHLAPTVWTK